MHKSLRALLSGILDYAGLYPPASLELDAAIRAYAKLQRGPDAWMLARFLCGGAKLAALRDYRDSLFADGPALPVVVVGRSGATQAEFAANTQQDADDGKAFVSAFGARGSIEGYEVRLPADATRAVTAPAVRATIDAAVDAWQKAVPGPLPMFFESGLAGDWRTNICTAAEALTEAREAGLPAGLKLRTGGLEPAAFPTPEQVAVTILACRDAGVPLKFTAGLHHPLRRFDPGVRCEMHGFLNLFAGAVLANSLHLELHDLQGIIEEPDIRHFHFSDEHLGWAEADATVSEIVHFRRQRVIGFGSCSFDEPRDDLRGLGLW